MSGRCAFRTPAMPLSMPCYFHSWLLCEHTARLQPGRTSRLHASVASRQSAEVTPPVLTREDSLSGACESCPDQDEPCSALAASMHLDARGHQRSHISSLMAVGTALLAAFSCSSGAALAATHAEPSNALSVPTWCVNASSDRVKLSSVRMTWRPSLNVLQGDPRLERYRVDNSNAAHVALCRSDW